MKTLFAATLLATLFTTPMAFAIERPVTQPVRGTEGPDVRHVVAQPVKGIEGPDARLYSERRPILGAEGAAIR